MVLSCPVFWKTTNCPNCGLKVYKKSGIWGNCRYKKVLISGIGVHTNNIFSMKWKLQIDRNSRLQAQKCTEVQNQGACKCPYLQNAVQHITRIFRTAGGEEAGLLGWIPRQLVLAYSDGSWGAAAGLYSDGFSSSWSWHTQMDPVEQQLI